MFITMIGNAFHTHSHAPIDHLLYTLRFELDHASIESGTYLYGPDNTLARRLGGSEVGLSEFYELKLRLKLRQGGFRSIRIDLHSTMHTFFEEHHTLRDAFDKGAVGGDIVVIVRAESVVVCYRTYQRIDGSENQRYFKSRTFPVTQVAVEEPNTQDFQKTLTAKDGGTISWRND